MSAANEESSRKAATLSAGLGRKVEALLDAAFRQLQHDTGEHDVEYRFQRDMLKKEFKRILLPNAPAQGCERSEHPTGAEGSTS